MLHGFPKVLKDYHGHYNSSVNTIVEGQGLDTLQKRQLKQKILTFKKSGNNTVDVEFICFLHYCSCGQSK